MSFDSGPMDGPKADEDTELINAVIDYGEACREHGVQQAMYDMARQRDKQASDDEVRAANQRQLVAYARFRWAMPDLKRTNEPGD